MRHLRANYLYRYIMNMEKVSYKLLNEFEDELPFRAKEVYGKAGKSVKTKTKKSFITNTLLWLLLLLIKGCVQFT